MHARSRFGTVGEDLAADYLQGLGFEVVARNFQCAAGEIDGVAMKGRLLVFCEVKTRTGDAFGVPAEAVGYAKQARMKRVAAHWLTEHKPGAVDVRFDVVSVIFRNGTGEVTHIPDAF
jgi:putative endonuclease